MNGATSQSRQRSCSSARAPRSVPRRTRALLTDEIGTLGKPWGSALPIALVYPNSYFVGMSSLGFQTLYGRLNSHRGVAAERFFWDIHDPLAFTGFRRRPRLDGGVLELTASTDLASAAQTTPSWPRYVPLSMENQRPLRAFPLLAFSVAFEMDYLHLVDMLVRSGIEPWAALRGPDEPVVVVGGAAVTMNRLPIYDFVDVVVHGDGETAADLLAEILVREGPSKPRMLAAMTDQPGFEVTQPRTPNALVCNDAPAPPKRLSLADRIPTFDTRTIILSPHTEFALRGLVEISRGCPYRCTFCIMGYQPYHYRWRTPEQIEQMVRVFLPHTRRIGLVASAVGIHKQIDDICARLTGLGAEISFSSLRVEDTRPAMVDALVASGQKTLTIAPEAGNDALRRRLRKDLSDEHIMAFVADAIGRGLRNVKLYYMIGLPGETDADVLSIADLTFRLHHVQVESSRSQGRIGHLALNIGVFVPKPGTPDRMSGFVGVPQARHRLRLLERELRRIPNLKVHCANPHHAAAQAVLSCGDRRVADFLWWTYQNAPGNWPAALRAFPDLVEQTCAPPSGPSIAP